ncbi:MAG: tyrosine--tRNA ligase [Elusimicrobiota bacterium]
MEIARQVEVFKKNLVDLISEEELISKLKRGKPLRIKLGVDPTAPDLHLGHTVSLHKLRQLQDIGHQVVFIIGDFTACIGDPSGRSATRPSLTKDQVLVYAKSYTDQVFKILDKSNTEVVFNSSWLDKLGISGMLNLASRYTVARMIERDDFHKRYTTGVPITILEFLYPLMQGYDSVAVRSDLELGGTDQKFNLLVGRELQKEFGQEPQLVATLPLLEGTDGIKKMSKSYGNYIGIDEPAKDMFGKLMSVPDDIMYKYFQIFTDLDINELKTKHPRDNKVLLAKLIVAEYHSSQEAEAVSEEFARTFTKKEFPQDAQTYTCPKDGMGIIELLLETKLASSKNEARRLIQQHAVEIGDRKAENDKEVVNVSVPLELRVGKRRFIKVLPPK